MEGSRLEDSREGLTDYWACGQKSKKRERGSRVLDLERMLQAEESVCAKALR